MENFKMKIIKKWLKETNPIGKSMFADNMGNLAMAILGTTILSVAILCVPQLIQKLLDNIVANDQRQWLQIAAMAAFVLTLEITAGILTYRFRTAFSAKAVAQYRNFSYDYLMKKKVSDFYRGNTAVYLSAMSTDVTRIKDDFLDQIPIISQIIICGIGAVVVMMRYNVLLTIVACAISIIPFAAAIISGKNMPDAEEKLSDQNASYLGFLKDFTVGFTVIKSYMAENIFLKLHHKSCRDVEASMLRREQLFEKVNYFAAVSGYITQFAVLFSCVAVSLLTKNVTAGMVIAFSQLIRYIIDPMTELPSMITAARSAFAMSEKFWNAIKCEDDASSFEGESETSSFDGNVSLEDIEFEYDGEKKVLNKVSLDIKKGEKVVVIGTSGCGKSTVLKLIMGILKPSRGKILYDGIERSDESESQIFKLASYIQQEVFIFDGSIYDNITLYQKYDANEVERAIEKAGLNDLIAEKGLDYKCGENGANLSGGEKQRISIARSLLRRTSLLIADEITAALDKETSYRVMSSLMDIDGLTELLVLHDLDSRVLSKADKIVVMKDGVVEEQGKFEDLVDTKGYFYSLYNVITR